MDDDGGDWFADAGDDAPPPEPEAATAAAAGDDAAPAAADGGEATNAAAEEDKGEAAEDDYLDPDKLLLFRHWIRPRFLQYKYLFDYRHNYYNDVIDYLDKRQRGVKREVPQAQTWAERALRTYTSQTNRIEKFRKVVEDVELVTKTKISGAFQLHHSKNYINRRYSSILY